MGCGVDESGLPRPRSMRSAPLARTRAVTASVMTKPYGGSASARGKDQLVISGGVPLSRNPQEKSGPPEPLGRAAGPRGSGRAMWVGDEPPRDPRRRAERRRRALEARAAPEHGEPAERPRAHPAPTRAQRKEL